MIVSKSTFHLLFHFQAVLKFLACTVVGENLQIINQMLFVSFYCSGQAAVITPRLVTSGLGARRVKAIAAAKHHTVVATEGGEVFTWGSNRGKSI